MRRFIARAPKDGSAATELATRTTLCKTAERIALGSGAIEQLADVSAQRPDKALFGVSPDALLDRDESLGRHEQHSRHAAVTLMTGE